MIRYNAAFEWYCLSKYFGLLPEAAEGWLSQWHCTMVHGLYCGYPAGLRAVGEALGLGEEKSKMTVGRSLISLFCKPVKPAKSNGGRTRTLPEHEPEKWQLFKTYCAQDVTTEMAVEDALHQWPVPPKVRWQWLTDMRISARGVALDEELMLGALDIGNAATAALMEEAQAITGLDNPNSVAQLKKWVGEALGEEPDDLRKATVAEMLTGDTVPDDRTRRILEIRQALGKTSTKKYDAMEAALCADGRIRGLLQFYGASRTGRWAGRLVQVQNLPQTKLPCVDFARARVKARDSAALELIYGNTQDTLSQLVRTAFVPAEGKVFVDADFSAIEARVLAWLAGEQWVLDVFRGHGKIYEATASQMFGVPIDRIVRGNPEYALRAKGKVATLALGYNGGPGALAKMGALRMGIAEEELPGIVQKWRRANQNIVAYWADVEAAATAAIQGHGDITVGYVTVRMDTRQGRAFLVIDLPSGRSLYYADPGQAVNRFGRTGLVYQGVNDKNKWGPVDTYGGKLTENITQAVARDILAEAIERLEAAGYQVVFHVHDEVVVEVSTDNPEKDLAAVKDIMGQSLPWAPGLPLAADGWVGDFYTKD